MKEKFRTGLIVTGKTSLDNDMIGDLLEKEGFYGEWNPRQGFWFIPEEEDLYDQLEYALESAFSRVGINARFEGIFS